jgi:hypothetical protein
MKRRGIIHGAPAYAFSPHTWQLVDEQMGYHSFDPLPETAAVEGR